jgi:hypothetical protein
MTAPRGYPSASVTYEPDCCAARRGWCRRSNEIRERNVRIQTAFRTSGRNFCHNKIASYDPETFDSSREDFL